MSNNVKTLTILVFINVFISLFKFQAYFFTHSAGVLTDALESLVNIIASIFALFAARWAEQPADSNHHYGHGKMELFSVGFEGGLIALAGIAIIFEAIQRLIHPIEVHDLEWGIILTAISGFLNFLIGTWLKRKGKKNQYSIMVASGKHLITDTLTSAALVIGLCLVLLTGKIWLDSAIAIIFGLVILYTGYELVQEAMSGLLDEADEQMLAELIQQLETKRKPEWIDFHKLRLIKFGARLHIDAHVTLPWYWSLEQSHNEVDTIEQIIKEKLGDNTEFYIHTDPCVPEKSCRICNLTCAHRQFPFEKQITWTVETLLPNHKHTTE